MVLLLLVLLMFACRSFLGFRFGSGRRHGGSGGRSRGHHVFLGLCSVADLLGSGLNKAVSISFSPQDSVDDGDQK